MKTHHTTRQSSICRIVSLGSLILLLFAAPSVGQVKNDSLPEVQVTSTRYKVPAIYQPQQVLVIGPEVLEGTSARDLVSLLSLYGHAYLRSNGPGLASGLTQRGFGTTSFQVVRDGFTLNQPMHGQVDMALISVSTLGLAEIATANASSTFGSAAPGGSLLLGSGWNQGWKLSHERGPWGYQESFGSFVATRGNNTYLINAGSTSSDNNYAYTNTDQDTQLRRDNSSFDRKWIQLGTLAVNNKYSLRTNAYGHIANREIPDPINFLGMEGVQDDEEIRLTAELTGPGSGSNWSVGAQVWQSRLLYNDIWLTERSYNRVRGASLALQYDISPKPWFDVTTSVGGDAVGVSTNNFESPTSRNALNGTIRALVNAPAGLVLFPAVRLDVIEDIGSALSPSIGLNKPLITNVLHIRSQWSYNFTAPTLNDQYWIYGGNPDLQPERAHKADIGLHYQTQRGRTKIDWQALTYLTRAKNGIVWQPGEGGMWSPINLQEMHGHGIEQNFRVETIINKVKLHTGSQVTWNRAFIPRARFVGDTAVNNQLRYTPEWMIRIQAGASIRQFQLNTELSHDGKRYSSEDHSSAIDPMPSYTLANVSTQYRFTAGSIEPSVRLSLVNAFNATYSTLAWYPMPGRHLLVAVRVSRK